MGFRDQCKQAVGSLFLSINQYDDEDEDDLSAEDDEWGLTINEESKVAIQLLQNLATLAPSPEIRELLFSLIDAVAEELLPAFQFADQSMLDDDLSFNNAQDDYSIDLCKRKSLWKRFRKWCSELRDWLQDAVKIFKAAKDIKETYEEWKKSNQYNGTSYEEFKKYHNQIQKKNH